MDTVFLHYAANNTVTQHMRTVTKTAILDILIPMPPSPAPPPPAPLLQRLHY